MRTSCEEQGLTFQARGQSDWPKLQVPPRPASASCLDQGCGGEHWSLSSVPGMENALGSCHCDRCHPSPATTGDFLLSPPSSLLLPSPQLWASLPRGTFIQFSPILQGSTRVHFPISEFLGGGFVCLLQGPSAAGHSLTSEPGHPGLACLSCALFALEDLEFFESRVVN